MCLNIRHFTYQHLYPTTWGDMTMFGGKMEVRRSETGMERPMGELQSSYLKPHLESSLLGWKSELEEKACGYEALLISYIWTFLTHIIYQKITATPSWVYLNVML